MFETSKNSPNGSPFSEGQPPVYPVKPNGGFLKKLPRYILLGLAVILVLAIAGTCWYTVDD